MSRTDGRARSWGVAGSLLVSGALLALLMRCDGDAPLERDEDPSPSRGKALVIGIGDYPEETGWPDLAGAPRDARRIASLLVDQFGFAQRDVLILIDEEATREAILGEFRRHLIDGASSETLGVFYFAGHGSWITDEEGDEGAEGRDETLVPWDALDGQGRRQDVLDDELGELFDAYLEVSDRLVGLFDCCHSGTMVRGPGGDVTARSVPGYRGPMPAQPRPGSREPRVVYDREVPLTRAARSIVTLAACGDHQKALESDGRGVFSRALESCLLTVQPGETWRDLGVRVRGTMRRAGFLYQSPVVFGAGYLPVFAGQVRDRPVAFQVVGVTDEQMLQITGGTVHGIQNGTRLAIEPIAQLGLPRFTAVVTETSVTSCLAKPLKSLERWELKRLDGSATAVIAEGPDPRFLQRILLNAPEAPGAVELRRRLESSPRYEPVEMGPYDLWGRWSEAAGYEVFDAGGEQVLPHPLSGRLEHGSAVFAALECYAIWRAVAVVENPDGPLHGAIQTELRLGCVDRGKGTESFREDDSLWDRGPAGEPPVTFGGDRESDPAIQLRISNRAADPVFLTIFDLTPSWKVALVDQQVELLANETEEMTFRVQALDWPGAGARVEVVKVFVTEQPESFEWVGSRGLDGEETTRGGGSGPEDVKESASSLAGLLRMARSGGVRGDSATSGGAVGHWTTVSIEFYAVPSSAEQPKDGH